MIKLFFRKERKFYFFICRTAGYIPNDLDLYRMAFVHKSAHVCDKNGRYINNERLEYLGDGVLDCVVAEILYKMFPDADEGRLSSMRSELVSRHSLNMIAAKLGFYDHIISSTPDELSKTHLPGDALEAFVACLYLDSGMRRARRFVNKYVASKLQIESMINDKTCVDFKSLVIRYGQLNHRTVDFRVASQGYGGDGAVRFVSHLFIDDQFVSSGVGSSKRLSEQAASKSAADVLGLDVD